jgi:hypothetical protein
LRIGNTKKEDAEENNRYRPLEGFVAGHWRILAWPGLGEGNWV